jgi:putative NADH-flavin reductase
MKLVIFGAGGKVGQKVVVEALRRGHEVTAFVHRSKGELSGNSQLVVVQGDIHVTQDVKNALAGQAAVISALGSWGTPSKDILASAMRQIIPAMEQTGMKRIVTLTGNGASDLNDKPNLIDKLMHTFLGLMAAKILDDGEEHLRLLRNSQLAWTTLRSPVMSNGGGVKADYQTTSSGYGFA